jgi:hypothetical protein
MSFKETYNIDAAQAERALKNLAEAQKRLETSADSATKKLSAEDKAARRIAEAADPMKRYNRQLEEAAILAGKGKISLDEARIAAEKYGMQLDRVGGAGRMAFGGMAVSSLATYAAGLVSVQGVASGIQWLFKDVKQQAEEAASRVRDNIDAVGQLQQLTGWSENRAFMRELRREGVSKDDTQAADLAFALDSAGLNEAEQRFVAFNLVKNRFIGTNDAYDVSLSAKKATDLLGYSSLQEGFDKLTTASGGTSANIPSLATATTKYASAFRAAGFSADESLAAIEVGDKGSANVDVAAERLKAFAAVVEKNDLFKGSLPKTISAITERIKAGEKASAILGDQNAIAGYRLFDEAGEMGAFNASQGRLANAAGAVAGRIGEFRRDPIYGPAIQAQEAAGALNVGREDRVSALENAFQAGRDRMIEYHEGRGEYMAAYGVRGAAMVNSSFANQGRFLENMMATERGLENTNGGGGAFSKEFEQQLLEVLRETATASRRTADAVDSNPKASAE